MRSHHTDDFPKLLGKLGQLINIPTRIEVTPDNAWKNHGQVMVIKAYSHLESIAELAGSRLPPNRKRSYVDHGSIAVLARATYETYVLFNFVFLEKDPARREFRHQVWRLSGLMSRMKLNRPPGLTAERLRQIEQEEAEISRLRPIIESSPFFAELGKADKKNVRQGDGVRLGAALIDLAEQAGLPRKYVADMYTNFCNYSHAGAISVFQLSETLQNGSAVRMASVTVGFCCILLSQIIMAYAEFFQEVDAAVAADEELCELLALWQGMGNALTDMYTDLSKG